MCENRTLAQVAQAHISQCTNCNTVFLWHNNLLLNFPQEDFIQFSHALQQREFDDYSVHFPDGEERVIMYAPCPDISFSFTRAEWRDMRMAVSEALLMQQVYALI